MELPEAIRKTHALMELEHKLGTHLQWTPKDCDDPVLYFLCLSLCGEAGELANLAKKDWRGDAGRKERRQKMTKELTDVAGYAFLIARHLGIDLIPEMVEKLQEVEQRPAFKAAMEAIPAKPVE